MTLSTSPDRNTFQLKRYEEKLTENPDDKNALDMIDLLKSWEEVRENQLLDPKFQENNMEYDLRSTQWVIDKVRQSDNYAQNLYAAICNNVFYKPSADEKERMLQVLKNEYPEWSASWRSAGGIIAHLRGEGDYMNWYCSGSLGNPDNHGSTPNGYVNESIVTDEIRDDLKKLGWHVVDSDN